MKLLAASCCLAASLLSCAAAYLHMGLGAMIFGSVTALGWALIAAKVDNE